MIDNIRSSYILKFIFEYIKETKKLKIIKYNKIVQNRMHIDIFNYKIICGKYLICESKVGKGKEYDSYNKELIFEGDYLNGERNGKGKE